MKADKTQTPNLAGLIILSALLVWGASETRPFIMNGEIQPLPAILAGFAVLSTFLVITESLSLLARFLEWLASHKATGKGGTARWARVKDIRKELNRKKQGPFWGVMTSWHGWRRTALFIDFVSNACCIAPAGSGKGIYTVVPMGLSIRHSKTFSDFKSELVCILKQALEKRGENVRILNAGELWSDIIGEGDSYNPLDIIAEDLLQRPGGLRDVPDDLREIAAQILSEPASGEGENTYWREGSRRLIAFVIILEIIIEGYEAALSSVALLLEDRRALEHNLRWVVGVDLGGKPLPEGPMPMEEAPWADIHDPEDVKEFARLIRSWTSNWLAMMSGNDSRAFDSFLTGAQQALAPFAFGRLAPSMRRSTFSMNDLKEGDNPTSLFIVADASRMEAYRSYIGLIQFCAMSAIKRHPDKARPAYFIMDEVTNFKINNLENLLTWGRSYGLRLLLVLQDISAFERVYGKTALETLLSETEIKQFLPGQRSPRTLELLEKILGEQGIMSASLSVQEQGLSEQMSEAGRPLMKADEIRRSKDGILLVRGTPPVLFTPISYAQVHPWRKMAGINPFHGKPFLKKVKLRV